MSDKKNSLLAAAVGTFLTDNASSHCTQIHAFATTLRCGNFWLVEAGILAGHAGISKLSIEQIVAHIIDAAQKSASLLSIANSFRACAITTVVQNGKLIAQFFQESIDRVIKAIQADNAAVPVPLVDPKRRRRVSKFGPLNVTPKK
ncbi:MAG: hypothetical protein EZS28_008466 [Streblomastix strix]|uniref:Uncharacterized protein n=1 Tax=Streblomastix strix TaxID=222440 RepID=A0A5J4WMJ6_9EUKA|nr:MAG: hypothetical protein EZS28_008466 [Streblomastix strix]